MARFQIADGEAIAGGRTTDVYFARALEILEREGEDPDVVVEVRVRSLPGGWPWAILAGVEEAASLLPPSGGPALRALASWACPTCGTAVADALQPPPDPYPPVAELRARARAALLGVALDSPLT